VVKFFPNVDHQVLLEHLGRTIRDDQLMSLVGRIIDSGAGILDDEASPTFFPGDDLFALCRPRGLPIGNLTSQFFANVLLDPVDHFIKEELRVPGYVRYADDLVLFGDSKCFLRECRDRISDKLSRQRLRLHRHKTQLRPSNCRLTFLGFVVTPDSRRLTQDAIRRFNRRTRRQRWLNRHGMISPARITESLRCWLAHAAHANSTGIRRAVWRRLRF
jgi:retron-type reverse transcriptase